MRFSWQGKHLHSSTRNLGVLALIFPLLERMQVETIIDAHLPQDVRAEFNHGKILSLLIAARLCKPSALVNIPHWADDSGGDILWQIDPDKLNDDRLGRALDKFFYVRHSVLAHVALHVSKEFKIRLDKIHYDPTHILFSGEYASAAAREAVIGASTVRSDDALSPAHITKGRATDDAPLGSMMIHVGLATLVDEYGPLPFFGHTIDGNQNGHTAIHEFFSLLTKHLTKPKNTKLEIISDRGTMSTGHLLRLRDAGYAATCSAPWGEFQEIFQEKRDSLKWYEANYRSIEQQRRYDTASELPLEKYEYAAIKHTLEDEDSKRKIPCRLIFIFSTADQKVACKQRQKQIDSCREQLEKIKTCVRQNRNKHASPERIAQRTTRVLLERKAGKYFSTTLKLLTKSEQNRLPKLDAGCRPPTHSFEYTLNTAQVQEDEEFDGYSVLATTVDTKDGDADAIFNEFKKQNYSEHVNSRFKGPIAVRPVFLKSPQRVEALVFLLMLALMAYFLLQRLYRQAVPKKALRAERTKTSQALFRTFTTYSLIINNHKLGREVCTTELRDSQAKLLRILGFPTPSEMLRRILPRPPENP